MTLKALLESNQAAVTEMIRLEVIGGAKTGEEFKAFRADFDAVHCLSAGRREWARAEELSAALGQAGRRVPSPDVLIAATALCYDVPLWHADRDFERIPQVASTFRTFWHPRHQPPTT